MNLNDFGTLENKKLQILAVPVSYIKKNKNKKTKKKPCKQIKALIEDFL